jgi:hypothetical protein
MGICYSEEEEWETIETNYQSKRKPKRNRKKFNINSIIYEEKPNNDRTFGPEGELPDD